MSERCRKTFLFLAYVVFFVGSTAYSFYLIWLLAYLKDNGNYWFFAFIPAFVIANIITAAILRKWKLFLFFSSGGVILLVMCSFTMLTRQAYYHLSADVLIGPEWVIMSLKGSIVLVVFGFFIEKECRLQSILESKDILSRGLLDFVDIFNLVELLSLNQCVGIGSSVTEGSSLEMAIQAFCTMSLVIMLHMSDISNIIDGHGGRKRLHFASNDIYLMSFVYQNIPFLIIRIIVWAKYNVFSLGFMVKNSLAIVVCCADIFQGRRVDKQNEEHKDILINTCSQTSNT